jgi:glycosyltransferase involved in cell wall biosynthesis
MKLGIVIPAHNEEKRIDKTLKKYSEYFKNLKGEKVLDYELIVVLNACTDNTEKIVKRYKENIKILKFEQGGKGFAVREGFEYCLKNNFEMIGFVDADMATSPEAFYDLFKNIQEFDGIIASRYVSGSKVFPKQSWQRIVASRIFNFLIQILFFMRYKDTQCGAKIFKKHTVDTIIEDLKITQWAFDVNLLYACKKNKLKLKESPTIWKDKCYSQLNLKKAGPQMLLSLIRLRLINSPVKWIVKIYDKIFGNNT